MNNLKVSFIIPTLNSEKVLKKCLDSIIDQNFSRKNYEILIIDGGSTDKTLLIAKKYNAIIFQNPLKTAEAGKAVGVKKSKGEYLALIDSDNILPSKNWLKKMLIPLDSDNEIIGSEPIEFTYREKGGIFERYSALIGANDPYAFITGVYDRKNYLNDKWTGLKIPTEFFPDFLKIKLEYKKLIPTIGANGTIFQSSFLKNNLKSDYLFDIDIISQVINKFKKPLFFAKVKVDIIHTFCESSFLKFIKKQKRRLIDYYSYQNLRQYDWKPVNQKSQVKFILYTIFIFPAFFDSVRGFLNKRDFVWFLHPVICLITFLTYMSVTIKFKLGLLKPLDRKKWKQ